MPDTLLLIQQSFSYLLRYSLLREYWVGMYSTKRLNC